MNRMERGFGYQPEESLVDKSLDSERELTPTQMRAFRVLREAHPGLEFVLAHEETTGERGDLKEIVFLAEDNEKQEGAPTNRIFRVFPGKNGFLVPEEIRAEVSFGTKEESEH